MALSFPGTPSDVGFKGSTLELEARSTLKLNIFLSSPQRLTHSVLKYKRDEILRYPLS
jgi:hypothetical protein